MDQTSIIAWCGFAISIASAVLGIINHKRIRSNCCGLKTEVSLDISPTISEPIIKVSDK